MSLFYSDKREGNEFTWEKLIHDIHGVDSYNPFCYSASYYEIFRQVIISMLFGQEIILLDADYSSSELVDLAGHASFEGFNKHLDIFARDLPGDKASLIEALRETSSFWRITLYTSGITGVPKKVTHTFRSITRKVRKSEIGSEVVWGFAFSPTHMAGVQVFLQALLNGNSIVRLFGLTNDEIHDEIIKNGITHISSTPSFYRNHLSLNRTFPSVQRITLGGEKSDAKTLGQLQTNFPNAKITNVYASTEAGSLFASNNDVFKLKPELEDLVKIEKNELFLHKSLLGASGLEADDWYATGDLVEAVSTEPLRFRFMSRKGSMINVGGYKVNAEEVEEALLSMQGITASRVYAKSNSVLGNIVCCEVICDDTLITESEIRKYLQSRLQEFKIPRMIRFVDQLTTTRTGKTKRT